MCEEKEKSICEEKEKNNCEEKKKNTTCVDVYVIDTFKQIVFYTFELDIFIEKKINEIDRSFTAEVSTICHSLTVLFLEGKRCFIYMNIADKEEVSYKCLTYENILLSINLQHAFERNMMRLNLPLCDEQNDISILCNIFGYSICLISNLIYNINSFCPMYVALALMTLFNQCFQAVFFPSVYILIKCFDSIAHEI